jgi:hypothetical protein
VVSTLVELYLGCWAVSSVATYLIGKRLAEDAAPTFGSLGLSVLAGMVWPFLLVALIEGGLVAAYCAAEGSSTPAAVNCVPLRQMT